MDSFVGLLVWRYSSHAESGKRARSDPQIPIAFEHRKDHGLQPLVVEGALDFGDLRQRSVLDAGPAGGGLLGS